MKIHQDDPGFRPVTITFETKGELADMVYILGLALGGDDLTVEFQKKVTVLRYNLMTDENGRIKCSQ